MSITGLDLYIRNDGLHVERGSNQPPAPGAPPLENHPPTITDVVTGAQTAGSVITLDFSPNPPADTTLYYNGVEYTYGTDFTVSGDKVNLVNQSLVGVPAGSITITGTDQGIFLPATFFQTSIQTLTGTSSITSFYLPSPVPSYLTGAIAALNGLTYVNTRGFTISDGIVTWGDANTALKAGDTFQLMTLNGSLVGSAFATSVITVTDGQTVLPLTGAVDASKVILVVSSNGYGGAAYLSGHAFTPSIDNSSVTWNGPALKATDTVLAIVPTDTQIASALVVGVKVLASGDLPTPSIPTAVTEIAIATLNNIQLKPGEYSVNGTSFAYTGALALKVGDELAFLGH